LLEAQIAALRTEFQAVEDETKLIESQDQAREETLTQERIEMGRRRGAAPSNNQTGRHRRHTSRGERT
jgi:hypothetical protein